MLSDPGRRFGVADGLLRVANRGILRASPDARPDCSVPQHRWGWLPRPSGTIPRPPACAIVLRTAIPLTPRLRRNQAVERDRIAVGARSRAHRRGRDGPASPPRWPAARNDVDHRTRCRERAGRLPTTSDHRRPDGRHRPVAGRPLRDHGRSPPSARRRSTSSWSASTISL